MTGRRFFISYRRDDTRWQAERVYAAIERAAGPGSVFMDIAGIAPGVDFDAELNRQLAGCEVMLALIGARWLDARNADGSPRLFDEDDFVRREIATGLARDVRVVPVLFDGAPPPPAERLPDDIRPLASRQALEIDVDRFDTDMARLLRGLGVGPRRTGQLGVGAFSATLALAAGIGGYALIAPGPACSAESAAFSWRLVEADPKIETLDRFLDLCPKSAEAELAEALRSDLIRNFQAQSARLADAERRIAELTAAARSLAPDDPRVRELVQAAARPAEELAFAGARAGSPSDLRRFLEIYPDGRHAEEAAALLDARVAERAEIERILRRFGYLERAGGDALAAAGEMFEANGAPAPADLGPATLALLREIVQATPVVGEVASSDEPRWPVGTELRANEVLETGDGSIQLALKDGTSLTVAPRSRLALDRYVTAPLDEAVRVRLREGALRFLPRQGAEPGKIEVKTPLATIGVRG